MDEPLLCQNRIKERYPTESSSKTSARNRFQSILGVLSLQLASKSLKLDKCSKARAFVLRANLDEPSLPKRETKNWHHRSETRLLLSRTHSRESVLSIGSHL